MKNLVSLFSDAIIRGMWNTDPHQARRRLTPVPGQCITASPRFVRALPIPDQPKSWGLILGFIAASRRLLRVCLMVLFAVGMSGASPQPQVTRRPNIVIILADDLGWGDLGCYGNPSIRTPNLDRMAAQGMRFTDFYSAAEVCTPSRAALLTGRYPIRSGMCHDRFRVLRRDSSGGLPAGEITIAQALKTCGYATACIGKWHLGNYANDPAHHPRRHGFDFYFGLPHSNDMNPTPAAPKGAPSRLDQQAEWWAAPLYRNEELIERPADQTTLTRRYTEEAVRFIHDHRKGPFLLYLAHTFPHVPLFASSRFGGQSRRGLYGDVVEEIDWSVGRVLEALRRERLDENTLVFFTSDNGPWLTQGEAGGSAGPLREGKGSTWEGGMREPGIAWWPKHVPAGLVTHELACTMDLFATSLTLAGATIPQDRVIDGVDMTPLLLGKGPSARNVLFYYRGAQLYAVRKGPFKAHLITQSAYGSDAPVAHEPPLLFHLGHDPSERFNVATNHSDVLADIAKEIERHRATVTPVKSQLEATVKAN
jgi:arylsulfatase A